MTSFFVLENDCDCDDDDCDVVVAAIAGFAPLAKVAPSSSQLKLIGYTFVFMCINNA